MARGATLITTQQAARALRCEPGALSSFSCRLAHVCIRCNTDLWWPAAVIGFAAEIRLPTIGTAKQLSALKAIEQVAGRSDSPAFLKRPVWETYRSGDHVRMFKNLRTMPHRLKDVTPEQAKSERP